MSTTLNKLEYLEETKGEIKNALNTNFNSGIGENDTFRSYVSKINDIYTNWTKVTGEGTELTLNNTKKGRMVLVLKGNTSQLQYTGYNLFNDYIEVGTINSNGNNADSTANMRNHDFIEITENTTYTISINESVNIAIRYYNENKTFMSSGTTSASPNTFTTPADVKYARFVFVSSTNTDAEVQLELGSTAHDWEPFVGGQPSPSPDYSQTIHRVTGNCAIKVQNNNLFVPHEEQNLPLTLGNMELCKKGDYQDYFFKDNGNWYKYKAIDKIVLDGSEEWYINSNVLNIRNLNYASTELNVISVVCDTYTGVGNVNSSASAYNRGNNTICHYNDNSTSRLFIRDDRFSNVSDFKTNLQNNNVTVYYVLEEPILNQITDTTLIEQLEAIENAMSYDNQTNISQTNDDLPFIISASALMKGGN